jgi:hypothetical protein
MGYMFTKWECITSYFNPWLGVLLFSGTLRRVKVCMNVGTNGSLFRLFFSAIEGLGFDFGLWNWKGKTELINYNAREGKKLFNLKEFFSRNVSKK